VESPPTTPDTGRAVGHRAAPARRRRRRPPLVLAVLVGAVALPPLVVAVAALGREWIPTGDWAMLEVATRDVPTTDPPLVGPYSRFGWNHPGPALFVAFALPYLATGGASWALLVAAAVVNGLAVAAMVVLAWRLGGPVLAGVVAVAVSVLVAAIEPSMLADPWNVRVTALPFGALVLSGVATALGHRVGIPVLVAASVLLTHSHLGFAPLVVVTLAIAVTGGWRNGVDRRWLAAGGAAMAAAAVPAVVDQFTGQGNLTSLVTQATTPGNTVGWGAALDLAAEHLGLRGPWLGIGEPRNPAFGDLAGAAPGGLVIPVVAGGAAMVAAVRTANTTAVWLLGTIAALIATGVVAVSRIDGVLYDWLVLWWWPLAALWWAAVAFAAAGLVPQLRPGAPPSAAPRAVAWVAAAVVTGIAAALVVPAWGFANPEPGYEPLTMDATAATLAALDTLGNPPGVVLTGTGPDAGWIADGLGLQIERAGVAVRVPDIEPNANKWRARRLAGPDTALWPRVEVVTGPAAETVPTTSRVFATDPLHPARRAARRTDEQALFTQLAAAGRRDLVEAWVTGADLTGLREVDGVDPGVLDRLGFNWRNTNEVVVAVAAPATGR